MKIILKVFLLAITYFSFLSSYANNPDLSLAYRYFAQVNIDESYKLYNKVWIDQSATEQDRSEAGLMLAKWHWLYYSDTEEAEKYLSQLTGMHNKHLAYQLWARIYASENQFDKGIEMLQMALELAQDKSDKRKILAKKCEYLLHKNIHLVKIKNKPIKKEIDGAIEILKGLEETETLSYAQEKILLGLGLFIQDASIIERSWLNYYAITDIKNESEILKESYGLIKSACDGGLTKPEILVKGLAKSGFVKWAALLAKTFLKTPYNVFVSDLLILDEAYDRVDKMTIQHYKNTVKGKANGKAYKKSLRGIEEEIWDSIKWPDLPPKFTEEKFTEEFDKRFGMVIRVYDNRFTGLHLGQAIYDSKESIQQHGYTGTVRYVKVDHMISNGFETWFWDGKLSHSGWINQGKDVFQVRLYDFGEREWNKVKNKNAQENRKTFVDKRRISDLKTAEKNPYAYLGGLHSQTRFRVLLNLYNSLPDDLSEAKRKSLFLNDFYKKIDEGTIIHECRHAVDKQIKNKWPDDDFEFRAKLSEIIFHEDPFFALAYGGILSPDTGGKGAHSQANLRINQGLVEWIVEHQNEIEGYKSSEPALYQLARLSDHQLKSAFKSMDPLAKH